MSAFLDRHGDKMFALATKSWENPFVYSLRPFEDFIPAHKAPAIDDEIRRRGKCCSDFPSQRSDVPTAEIAVFGQ